MIFVIGRYIGDKKHENLCNDAYKSVRKFYPESKIIIVDDNSIIEDPFEKSYNNVKIYYNEYPKSGELGLYYYFNKYCLENGENYTGVIMHDSMILKNKISVPLSEVKFLWFFPNRIHDDKEKIMDLFNVLNSKEILIKNYNTPFWLGCFGVTSIVKNSFLERIKEKYSFFNLFQVVKDRDHRCALERVFAVICYTEIGFIDHLCGNIFSHPGAFISNYDISKSNYSAAFNKKWLGR